MICSSVERCVICVFCMQISHCAFFFFLQQFLKFVEFRTEACGFSFTSSLCSEVLLLREMQIN